MKRRIIDKDNLFMIGLNTCLFAVALILVSMAWYKDYLTQKSLGFLSNQVVDFTNPVTLATIAVLFGAFFYSIVIIRPDRAKRLRERELIKLKLKSNQHDAYTDKETGIYNRLSFDRSLDNYLTEFNKIEETIGLLMVKIDNINALPKGVIKDIANAIENTARDYDIISRIENELIAVITPNVKPADLPLIAERYKNVIEKCSPDNHIRFSVGHAITSSEIRTPEMLVGDAEKNAEVKRRLKMNSNTPTINAGTSVQDDNKLNAGALA